MKEGVKDRLIRGVLRSILSLLGVGLGVLIAQQLHPMLSSYYAWMGDGKIERTLFDLCVGVLFGLVFFALSYSIADVILRGMRHFAQTVEEMSGRDVMLSMVGLVAGLLVAALCSVLVLAPGASLLGISVCALMYVAFGWTGVHIARHSYRKRRRKSSEPPSRLMELGMDLIEDDEENEGIAQGKVIDSSVLIDGRLENVIASGFLEGELVLPSFVLKELQRLADSAQEERRLIGKRGLAMAQTLCERFPIRKIDAEAEESVDAALLALCRREGCSLLTNDTNLMRLCSIDKVKALSLCALADALKPSVAAGELIPVTIRRKGKEPGQGVGYLEDGTMLVIANASDRIGQTFPCRVTQVRSSAAGRIVFASPEEEAV